MSTAVTSPEGPNKEQIHAAAPANKGSRDTRVQVGSALRPVLAAYVQEGVAIKRTYMRPTEMTLTTNAASYDYLDKITYSGTLVARSATTTGIPLAGEKIRLTVRANKSSSGAVLLTHDMTTDANGRFSYAVEDPKLYPGPSKGHYYRVDHTPSSSKIWEAPAVAHTYTVNPMQVVGNIFHTGAFGNSEGYYGNPWGAHVTTPTMATHAGGSRVAGGTPYIHATLSTEPQHRRDEMNQYRLWDDVKFSMWASALSNLDNKWTSNSGGGTGGISDYKHGERLWSATPAGFKNQIRSNAPFTVAGFNTGAGLGNAKAEGPNDIAFGVMTGRLGINRMNDALALTGGKGVAMIVLWFRVEDDAAATNRWIGGVYETNWNSPWHHNGLQPTYAPLVITKQVPAGQTLNKPGHNI